MRALIVTAVIAGSLFGQQGDAVVDRLSHAGVFAFGGVGFIPKRTQGEADFNAIKARATAESDFEAVFEGGSPEGKAYALVGIRKLDPAKFKVLAAEVEDSTETVQVGLGCVLGKSTLGRIVKKIESGAY